MNKEIIKGIARAQGIYDCDELLSWIRINLAYNDYEMLPKAKEWCRELFPPDYSTKPYTEDELKEIKSAINHFTISYHTFYTIDESIMRMYSTYGLRIARAAEARIREDEKLLNEPNPYLYGK